MALSQTVAVKPRRTFSRSLFLVIGTIGGMGLTGADEVLVSAPFITLNEALGFWAGWIASTAFWAALGLATLVTVDLAWPVVKPVWTKVSPALFTVGDKLLPFLIAVAVVAGLVLLIISIPRGNLLLAGLICGIAAAIFLLLVAYEGGEKFVEWVVQCVPIINYRWFRVPAKLFAGLLVLVYMGPVLSRPFLVPLGVKTRGWAYILTIVAAPFFAGVWYPVYTLGVWDTITTRIF